MSFRSIDSLLGQKDALVSELSQLRKDAAIAAKRIEVLKASVEFLSLPRETQLEAKQYADDLQHLRSEQAKAKKIERAVNDAERLATLEASHPDFFVPKTCVCGGECTFHLGNYPRRLSSGLSNVIATRYCRNCRSAAYLKRDFGARGGI